MEIIQVIMANSSELWAQVLIVIAAFGALLKGLEALISMISPYTPWKWDNDLADNLGKLIAHKIFQRK